MKKSPLVLLAAILATTLVLGCEIPLYYYAGDNAPSDINGQGVDDEWYAMNPDMGPLVPAPPTTMKGSATTIKPYES